MGRNGTWISSAIRDTLHDMISYTLVTHTFYCHLIGLLIKPSSWIFFSNDQPLHLIEPERRLLRSPKILQNKEMGLPHFFTAQHHTFCLCSPHILRYFTAHTPHFLPFFAAPHRTFYRFEKVRYRTFCDFLPHLNNVPGRIRASGCA